MVKLSHLLSHRQQRKLLLVDDVRRLYNALHGQTLKVGNGRVGIVVGNDLSDGQHVPGKRRRGKST